MPLPRRERSRAVASGGGARFQRRAGCYHRGTVTFPLTRRFAPTSPPGEVTGSPDARARLVVPVQRAVGFRQRRVRRLADAHPVRPIGRAHPAQPVIPPPPPLHLSIAAHHPPPPPPPPPP